MRNQRLVNTDPQRRCYNGAHYSSKLIWTPWETLESNTPPENIEGRLDFWRELNEYAVSKRGKSATTEYRVAP